MRLPDSLLRRLILAGIAIPGLSVPLMAQTTVLDTFVLGTIYLGEEEDGQGGTTSKISGEEARKAGRTTLNDTLATLPGVSSINTSGGSRNEPKVFVRGFDRWHVPLSIDGIRVYLPADNRLDYGRFLTPDLSEIQVQKSYVSVLNGPGGMGGAINLVTKKPTQAFEGEARIGIEGGQGDVSGRSAYLSFGTKREKWYAQASWMKRESDGFWLSKDFVPVPNEDGGLRNNADTSDSRVNLKFGYTPNATDEYVLSYTQQTGSKNAPYSTRQPMRGVACGALCVGSTQRDWTWPEWDISSLALYTHTDLGGSYVKTRVYYNTFDNTLSAWDDPNHATQAVNAGRIFNSVYDDYSLGASAEYGLTLGAHDLKAALHFRRDVHASTNYPRPGATPTPAADPTEHSKEETVSLAIEDSWQVSDKLRIVGGLSYNKAEVKEADRTTIDPGLPLAKTDALDWQLAAIWAPDAGGEFHASVSSRTSFPTLFHRYSTRFGTFEPNPDLKAERAANIELGYSGDLGPVSLEGAVFYSRVTDLIRSVVFGDPAAGISQQQNVGKGVYKGFELAAGWAVNDRLGVTANYTYIDAGIEDPMINGLRITDIPNHKFYLALDWQATDTLTVTPSVEVYGARWSDPAAGQPGGSSPTYAYTKMGSFALANFGASWHVTPTASVDFGIRNLLDRNYSVVEGFREAGRTFYLTSGITF